MEVIYVNVDPRSPNGHRFYK